MSNGVTFFSDVKLFLMSTKLAACGLTLIAATYAFLMDPTLSPGISFRERDFFSEEIF